MSRFIKVSSHKSPLPMFLLWHQVELISSDTEGVTRLEMSAESSLDYVRVTESTEGVAAMIEAEEEAEWGAPANWLPTKAAPDAE